MSISSDLATASSTSITQLSSIADSVASSALKIVKKPTTWAIAGAGAAAGLLAGAVSSYYGSSTQTQTYHSPKHLLSCLRADFEAASLQPGSALAHEVGGTMLMLTEPEAECLSRAVNYVFDAEDADTVMVVDQFLREKGAQGVVTWMDRPTECAQRWGSAARDLALEKMEEARRHAQVASRMSCSSKQTGLGKATSLTARVVSAA